MELYRIWVFIFVGVLSLISSGYAQETTTQPPSTGRNLFCYTCMSDNIPAISKGVMRETINLPEYAESRTCSGPLPSETDELNAQNIKIESCNSACVKVVSENKYLKLVIRGCLDKLYAITSELTDFDFGALQPDATGGAATAYGDNCDRQKHESPGIGETITDTCLCMNNYCNGSSESVCKLSTSLLVLLILIQGLLAFF